ncbi:MAG: DUF1957 domain-containing protein [Candidatus Omnitrophica bacterium]|nr:DUF1957 domain-containing protein [Candidatus Omnitrophota bacterium]
MAEKGFLSLILHAHLPFVRHPEYEEFLEERWLFEALTETYIPLLLMMEKLWEEGVDFRLTMNISPTLCSMLEDELLQRRYVHYLEKMIELCEKEITRTRYHPQFNQLAYMYYHIFTQSRHTFLDKWKKDILSRFRALQEKGKLEIITCGATHGYLPLLAYQPAAVRAQIKAAVASYRCIFKRQPKGIWLPECGYFEGLDSYLKEVGIKYFILETHGLLFSRPRPKFGVYSSYYTPAQVAVFGRDMETSKSVWSAKEGYPGDYNYREYYRDIGFDLDYDYLKPYMPSVGSRIFLGIKYYRITGPGKHKKPYNQAQALEKAAEHAGNFMFNRQKQIEYLYSKLGGRKPIIVSPYDAELFGHWWFEGVNFLDFLIRKIYYDQSDFKLITPSEYLRLYPRNQKIRPAASSWGWKGYSEVWLNGSNDWIYPHLHRACELMHTLARHKKVSFLKKRVLNQMARELLLAQSSDWPFIMKTGTFTQYVRKRFVEHLQNFYTLYYQFRRREVEEDVLRILEDKDNIFPEINYAIFA